MCGMTDVRELYVPKLDPVSGDAEVEDGGRLGGGGGGGDSERGCDDVAMTRNVVRSKRMTSVALHASASLTRCFVRTEAFGMRVCTMRDQAYP